MPTLACKYAGVLGTLAMSVVLLRAIKDSSGSASVLWTAVVFLASFSAAGLVVGWVAEATVVGSVKAQFEEQVQNETRRAAEKAAESPPQG